MHDMIGSVFHITSEDMSTTEGSTEGRTAMVQWLCLNPTAQKDNRGVLGASFQAEEFSEIVGYSNMADYTLS